MVEKAKAVDLANAKNFVKYSKTQFCIVLHELAHAYHDQILSFDDPTILDAFKNAKSEGLYDSVLHMSGNEKLAYAMTDHKEYFAELTEAYFGTNDFYPFVRPELLKHDPVGYEMIETVWGLHGSKENGNRK